MLPKQYHKVAINDHVSIGLKIPTVNLTLSRLDNKYYLNDN